LAALAVDLEQYLKLMWREVDAIYPQVRYRLDPHITKTEMVTSGLLTSLIR